jgi:hypothetical protein
MLEARTMHRCRGPRCPAGTRHGCRFDAQLSELITPTLAQSKPRLQVHPSGRPDLKVLIPVQQFAVNSSQNGSLSAFRALQCPCKESHLIIGNDMWGCRKLTGQARPARCSFLLRRISLPIHNQRTISGQCSKL